MIETLPFDDPQVRCRVTAPVRHLCPVREEVDEGMMSVEWATTGVTLELHSLAAYLSAWADWAVTHEELCARIAADIADAGVIPVAVTFDGATAGLAVHVSREPDAVLGESVRR